MEFIFLLIPLAILAAVYIFRGESEFTAPEVSPIGDADLRAFEAAPSLFVNANEAALFNRMRDHLPPQYHIHSNLRPLACRCAVFYRCAAGLDEGANGGANGKTGRPDT